MSNRTSHAFATAGQSNPPHVEMKVVVPNVRQSRQSIEGRETMPNVRDCTDSMDMEVKRIDSRKMKENRAMIDEEIRRVYEKVEETEKKILAEFAQQTNYQITMQQDVVRVIGSAIRDGIQTELKRVEEYKRQCEDIIKKKEDELNSVMWQLCQEKNDHESEKSTYVRTIQQCQAEIKSLRAELGRKSDSEATAKATTQRYQLRIQQLEDDLAMAQRELQQHSHRQQESTRQQGIACQQPDHTLGLQSAEEPGFLSSLWTALSKGKTVKASEVKEMEIRWRADTEKRNSELKKMQAELDKRNGELESANRTIRKKEDRITRLSGKLLDDTHKPGGEAANRYTHSGLLREYEGLYTTKKQATKRALERIGIQPHAQFDEVLGQIFPVAYDECKAVVLQMLFRDLFHPHKDGEDTKSAGQQARIYGHLLQLSPDLHLPLTAILDKFSKGNIWTLRTRAKWNSISEVEDYLKESVELAWKMVTINPPMIADRPAEFDEDLHDQVFEEWSEASEPFDLVYRRPVLYNSYRDSMPASKAKVGNKCNKPTITTMEIESEI